MSADILDGLKASTSSGGETFSRRHILLAGTALAASSLQSADALAQAQPTAPVRQAAPSGPQPNILVIFGDDIGQTNISA